MASNAGLKTLKWLAIIGAGLLGVAATALIAVIFFIDPAIFRDDLEALAEKQGVSLHLGGELAWRIYPQLQIITTDTALGGLDAEPLATIDSLAISVALRPLLRSQLQVTGITIEGLSARFDVDEDGSNNWQMLLPTADSTANAPSLAAEETPSSPPISIDKLRVSDSQLHYLNRQTAQTASIKNINLVVANLGQAGAATRITLDASLSANDPSQLLNSDLNVEATVTFNANYSAVISSDAEVDLKLHHRAGDQQLDAQLHIPLRVAASWAEDITVDNLNIENATITYQDQMGRQLRADDITVAGQYRPGLSNAWQLDAQLDASLAANASGPRHRITMPIKAAATVKLTEDINSASVTGASLTLLPASSPITLNGHVDLVLEPLTFRGEVDIAQFNPQAVAKALSLPLPPRADANTLSKAALRSQFSGSADSLALSSIAVTVDDTTARGSATLPLGSSQAPQQLSLTVDQLNLDRYLANPAQISSDKPGADQTAPTGQEDWDLSALAALNLEAQLKLDTVTVRNLPFADIALAADAHAGRVTLSRLDGRLYDSPFQLKATLATSNIPYTLQAEGNATALPVGRLLADLDLEERFTGNSDVTFKLSARGNNPTSIQRTLNGELSLTGRQLTLSGMNIEQAFCRLVTAVQQQAFNPRDWANVTEFADTTTRIRFQDGVARIEQLKAGVAQLAVSAQGKVDLAKATFDVVFNTRLASQHREQAPCAIENTKLLNRDIPIRCKASFDGIDISTCLPDMRVAEDIAKEKVKDKIDDKAKSLLKDKLGEEKSKAAEQLFKQFIKPSNSSPSRSQSTSPKPAATDVDDTTPDSAPAADAAKDSPTP